jgi:tetratricopeptide (TPR) repeat protein
MLSSIASSKITGLLLTGALLVGAASGLRPLEQSLTGSGVLRREQLAALAGQGTILPVVSGMRSAVASGYWLLVNQAWERREPAAMKTCLELTVAADERPVYYWLNGARMLAFDLPEWRMPATAPQALRQRIREEQAGVALQFLAKGLRWHGDDAALYVEMANIHLRCTGDLAAAAQCFRRAAQQPGAPYYAARIYADLLEKMGQLAEARDWLQEILPGLPANDAAARRTVVLDRIHALDQLLAAR